MHRGTALLYSGGVNHPFEETSPEIASLLEDAGWRTSIETEIDVVIAQLASTDLLAVNALRWSMTQRETYAPLRERWAFQLGDRHMDRIEAFVAGGGRLLVIHTGTICWDTQPRWRAVMGGGWDWSRSHHPPLGRFTVALTEAGRTASGGFDAFEVEDEAYHCLDPSADCVVLAHCDLGEGPQPLAWMRRHGEGWVAVDALGHDRASLRVPGHQALLKGQIAWLAGEAPQVRSRNT